MGNLKYCDDGNTSNETRCNQDCTGNVNGWTCTGGSVSSASTCITTCNDGYIAGSEQCEDGNLVDGDGCDSSCRVEAGFDCVNNSAKTSSTCTAICGDGLKVQGEACDDGDSTDEQGCLSDCSGEINGWHCSGGTLVTADTCVEQCNDGYITISEECEDSNLTNGDGCSSSCLVETYWNCDTSVSPSVCEPICGDGYFISGDEDCDDGNNYNEDGCDSNCKLETGWYCYDHDSDFYTPQECKMKCGNGIRPLSEQADEECDDGNTFGFDGCDHDCKLELGYICTGGSATTSDICVENVFRPSASITLTQNNNAVIKFNDTIQRFTIGSDDLYIQIYGSQSSYNYTWTAEFVDDTTVNVNMNIISEITGNGEDIYFEFPLTNNFKSSVSQRTVNPDQYFYFSLNRYQNSRSSGFLGQSSSYLFLASVLLAAISSFGGYSIEMMWKFTNSIQILFFMSYINVDLPTNLEELFPYLGISNAENIYFKQLCFMLFPEERFTDKAINSKIESSSFFTINSDKIIWIVPVTVLLFVIKLVDLTMLFWKPWLLKLFDKLVSFTKYNFYIRLWLECCIEIVFSSFINLLLVNMDTLNTEYDYASYILALLYLMIFLTMLVYVIFWVIHKMLIILNKVLFQYYYLFFKVINYVLNSDLILANSLKTKQFSCIYSECDLSRPLSIYVTIIFAVRRLLLCLVTVAFYKCAQVQLVASVFLCLFVIMYFYKVNPYKSQLINWMTLFDEMLILLCYVFMFYFSEIYDDKDSELRQYNTEVGWAAIGVLLVFFIGNLGYLLPVKIAEVYFIIKNAFHSYKDRKKLRKLKSNIRKENRIRPRRRDIESKENSSINKMKSTANIVVREEQKSEIMPKAMPKKVVIRKFKNLKQAYLPFYEPRPNKKLARQVQNANFGSIFN